MIGPRITVSALAGMLAAWQLAACSAPPPPAPPAAALGTRAACAAYSGLPPRWRDDPHAGMAHLRGGRFELGSRRGYADERPADAKVRVGDFWIDRTEVTNAQFAAFVAASGYVTEAERQGGAAVFHRPNADELNARPYAWWNFVEGASWKHPQGSQSDLRGRDNHPVTLVTLADAQAYAHWLGRELPTEAEWEYAAKAGRSDAALGEEPRDRDGHPLANYWQGLFPTQNAQEDGFAELAPVGCFAANGYALYDTIGNAWEWTRDRYVGAHQSHANGDIAVVSAAHAGGAPTYVIKGGSFLCSQSFCVRYRAAAREAQEADLASQHVGFRTVVRG
ncbi:SUMF1/EgtB/PvdO family nonheme iron enzyme [Solimonas soli]|uniref:SUMF1/EgtB/PvdO family nonheme iron enzyme n=1 Tax=Solimonas soli TaxID=413479 RepID=UPI0004877510|nr:SUMF1/EgtB/PvdO family nonheme iron enzyme [Solimonas soli]